MSENRGGRRFAGLTPQQPSRVAADQNWDRMYVTWPEELREPNFSGACSCLQAHVSFTLAGEGEALTHPLANFLETIFKERAA